MNQSQKSPNADTNLRVADLARQANELIEGVSLISVGRAAQIWMRATGDRAPMYWTQGQVDEVLLILIDQEASR